MLREADGPQSKHALTRSVPKGARRLRKGPRPSTARRCFGFTSFRSASPPLRLAKRPCGAGCWVLEEVGGRRTTNCFAKRINE